MLETAERVKKLSRNLVPARYKVGRTSRNTGVNLCPLREVSNALDCVTVSRYVCGMLTRNELPYGSGDIERLTGVTQAIVRDWRRRGLLASLGQEENGRWRYRVKDLVAMAVISQLSKSSTIDLQSAWELSGLFADLVSERIRGDEDGGRYFFTWPRQSSAEGVPIAAVDDDLNRAMSHAPSAVAICVDMDKLIGALPHALVEIVRGASDGMTD